MTEVAEGVHRLPFALGARSGCVVALVGEEATLLLDCGLAQTPARVVAPALRRLGVRDEDVRHVVVTHADVDHAGGLGAAQLLWPRARTACHALDRALIEDPELLLARRYRGLREEHGIDRDAAFAAWVLAASCRGTIDAELVDGDAIDLGGGWRVTALHLPGHTAGHLALHDPRSGSVLAGDAVLGAIAATADGRIALAPTYCDVDGYRGTLARLRALAPARLLLAHEPLLEGREPARFLAASARAVDAIERSVAAAVAGRPRATGGKLLADVCALLREGPAIEPATLAPSVVAHLERMAAAGVVRRLPGRPARWLATARRQTDVAIVSSE